VQASLIFLCLAVLLWLRAIFGRFYFSLGRYRSFFDQLLLRACWALLGFLFVLSWGTRPLSSPANFSDVDVPIAIFLSICCGLLEVSSLLLFRSRLEGDGIVVRADGFGELLLKKSEIKLIFHMRTGPEGLSNHARLLPARRIPSPIPKVLVYQVMLRTIDRHPLKYLVLAEVRSRELAQDLARRLATALDVQVLEDTPAPSSARFGNRQRPDLQDRGDV
jgi:hypothetical protein